MSTQHGMLNTKDYVYFETSSTSPFQIRRIEELNKTPSGNVEAKVMCFYRRRDISSSLIMLADKHQSALDDDDEETDGVGENATIVTPGGETLTNSERHQLRHRELFLSRQIETLPATHIRGKCTVTLLNETEALLSYLNKESTSFSNISYQLAALRIPSAKGRKKIARKVKFDSDKIAKSQDKFCGGVIDLHLMPKLETSLRQYGRYLVIHENISIYIQMLVCKNGSKPLSLFMNGKNFHAMDTLHTYKYDISKAVCSLIPSTGPVLCRDEMEEWSASEANLFEEALEKYGKDFNDIRQDFLPWKTLKNIIEYYYMWKTTDRYVQQKRVKAVEAESKLKQVYIPNYNKPNPAALSNGKSAGMVNGNVISESGTADLLRCMACCSTSSQWYAWGPPHMQCRLCSNCWHYWKKFGGLKLPSRIGREEERSQQSGGSTRIQRCNIMGCGREYKTRSQLVRHAAQAHGVALRAGSPRPIMKTRAAIMVHTSLQVRIMRRLCQDLIQPRKACRNPTWPINTANIKQESIARMGGKSFEELAYLVRKGTGRRRGRVHNVSIRLGQKEVPCPQWMLPTDPSTLPKPLSVAYPKPPKGPDGSLIYTPVPVKELQIMNNASQSLLKRRAYEETNGTDECVIRSEIEEIPQPPTEVIENKVRSVYKERSRKGAPPAKRPREEAPVLSSGMDALGLSHLGVSTPPGLTVTPLGINGGPGIIPPGMVSNQQQTSVLGHPPQGAPPPYPTGSASTPGRAKIATVSRIGGRPRIISWMDAPDDVYFYANETTK
ncbi:unnamed protein product, partial [Meganyctiphanes norvegica]